MQHAPHFQLSSKRDSINLTDRDLSAQMGYVSGAGGLNIQFFYEKVKISAADPDVNGSYSVRLCVAKMPKGDRLTIATRFISEDQAMDEYPREFSMFKQYESVPSLGTPLHELPGISQSQIAILVLHNLRSIEDVAECAPELINQMGIDARQAYAVAKRWNENRKESEPLIAQAARDAHVDAQMKEMRDRTEAAERANIELQAQIKAMLAMGGQNMGQHLQTAVAGQNGAQAVAVDRGDTFLDPSEMNSGLFEGGMVDGNDDLNEPAPQATVEDPLALKRKGR